MNPDACPTPGKIAYRSRRDAHTVLIRLPRRQRRRLGRPYRCACGSYHLGRLWHRPTARWRGEP